MNSYFLKILMKERQREFEEEFQRIHQVRAARDPGPGFLANFKRLFHPITLPITNWLGYLRNRKFEN